MFMQFLFSLFVSICPRYRRLLDFCVLITSCDLGKCLIITHFFLSVFLFDRIFYKTPTGDDVPEEVNLLKLLGEEGIKVMNDTTDQQNV